MKESQLNLKEDIQIVGQKEIEKKTKFIGSMKKIPGHTLFEFNLETLMLGRAEVKQEAAITGNGGHKVTTRVDQKENCIYIQALNLKNARRKLLRQFKEVK